MLIFVALNKRNMRKRFLKKSEVLHEGYVKGLKKAQKIINEMLVQSQGFDDDIDEFKSGSVSGVRPAIRAGAEKLSKENGKKLALACERGDFDLVKKLILLKADVNVKDKDGWTLLHKAVYYGDGETEIVRLLLEHGADVNAKDTNGWTPLHLATQYCRTEPCELLLQYGADVNVKDVYGWTPLITAARFGYTTICKMLLDAGADAYAKDDKGKTAYDVASGNDKRACRRLLKQYM